MTEISLGATHRAEDELSHLHKLIFQDLGLCGCGYPDEAYALVRDLLALAPYYEDGRWQRAAELIGSQGAQQIVLSMLDRAELLEHGSSVAGSWLTERGAHYLELMRRHRVDEVNEAGLPHEGEACPAECPHGAMAP